MTGIIIDVAVVVVTVLLLIFGIWRGMYKLIFGLVSALLALVLAVILVSPVTTLIVDKTDLDLRLTDAIDEPLSNTIPNGDIQIYLYDIDGDGVENELGFTVGDEIHPFSDALTGTPFAMLSGVFENAIVKNFDKDATDVTFISVLSAIVVTYIIMAIVFIVLLIVLSIVVALLMKLLKRFVTHTYIGHFFDKILGAVLGLVIAGVLVMGSLAIIRMLGTYEWIIPVNEAIGGSTLTKLIYENNFVYNMVVDIIDLQGILDGILGTMSGAGNAQSIAAGMRSVCVAI